MTTLAALRSRWRITTAGGGVVQSDTTDGIGTLVGLKAQTAVEHSEDDGYLTGLLRTAQQMVGSYTRWPMRTGTLMAEARFSDLSTTDLVCLPGPVVAESLAHLQLYYQGAVIGPAVAVDGLIAEDRLPHDSVIYMPDMLIGYWADELRITYPVSWASHYSGDEPWPSELATTIYRVAATLYLYREATTLGDRPVHRIMQASLGPYLPVVL